MAEREEDKNPLLNELVIENISRYLSLKELKVCRRLNHLWKKTTNKMFLKLCPTLFLMLYYPEDDDGSSTEDTMTLPQFMEIYSDLEHPHPHAQLLRQYHNFAVYDLTEEDVPMLYNFMTEVGPQMTSLELANFQVLRNSQDLADIVSSKYTPNLEELFIADLEEIGNYQQSDSKTVRIEGKENKHLRRLQVAVKSDINWYWLDVFSRYPKLKALTLIRFTPVVIEKIASALATIRKANETKLKLTELEISNHYGVIDAALWRKSLDSLKTANFPLEEMSLDCSSSEISSALIHHYAENLKILNLKDWIPQPFPLMKALVQMFAEGYSGEMTFLTKVPNLKSLSLYECFPENVRLTRFPKTPPSPLQSLIKFDGGVYKKWNVTEMEQLLLWMPNVQNLAMRLDNTEFLWICQHFPNLNELTVMGKDLDDSGVVGDFDEALVEGCRPNITNLKALETFEMAGEPVFNKGLTEKSVFYGFSLMPKLSKLTINVKAELSADAMLALNRGIRNVQVTVGLEKKEGEEEENE